MTSAVIMPMENALSGIAGIDQMSSTITPAAPRSITIRFLLERDLDDAANTVREKVAGAMRSVPPQVLPPVIQKQDPDADPIMSADAVVARRHEPADADRDRRQAGQARARVGRRRRRRHDERRPAARNPHRRRHREAERARPVDRPGARRDSERERRDAGRHPRAGQVGGRAAHARAHRRRRAVQRHHHRDRQRHADPRVATSATRRTRSQKAHDVARSWPTAARRCSSTSGARPARTPSR